MENTGLWLTPLLFLPGVALLVLSTATRFGQLHSEMHHLMEHPIMATSELINQLSVRATLFRDALVSLYISVGIFAVASLLGGLLGFWVGQSEWIIILLTFLGILALAFAAFQLIRESRLSLDIIREHVRRLNESRP